MGQQHTDKGQAKPFVNGNTGHMRITGDKKRGKNAKIDEKINFIEIPHRFSCGRGGCFSYIVHDFVLLHKIIQKPTPFC